MVTENLSTLKIHKLTKEQYERELAAGRIDENALYLTPDDTYTTGEIDSVLEGKADWGTSLADYKIDDAYTKTSADNKFETIENVNALSNSVSNKADKATSLSGYGISDAYTKTEADNKLNGKADKATTLAGYGITDAYTKTNADQKFETIENVNALENQISQIEKSIPTNVSQLTNDSNYATKNDVYASIDDHNKNTAAHNDIREEIVAVSDTIADHMTNTANPHGVKLVQLGVEASATELNVLKGITTSTAELNKLKGLNTSTAELNKLKGATITTAELNTLKGIGTSTVASQLSAVADAAAAAQRTADASMSNIEVTGSGNAITAASYDSTTRKLTLTKGANYAPTTRTINSKALSSDINLTAADVGALATDGSNVMTGNLFIEEADLCIDDGSLGIRNGDVVIDGNNPFVGLANKNATTQCELANLGNVTILTHMSLDDERTLEIHDNTSAPNIKNALIFSNVNDNGRNTYSVYHEGNKPTAADVGVSFTAAKTSGTHIGTITLDGVDTKIYCNSGDITGVTAGNGLTGGATNGTATLNVGAGDGISVTADAVALATSGVTAGTYGPGADVTGSNNTTMSVPEITVDTYGRVTNITNRTYTAKNSTYTVNNKTVTLTAGKGLTDGGSFTANQSSDKTITFNVGAGTGIAVNDNDVALATYGTAATYGPSDDATLSHSGTFTVPKITTDAYGRVTASNITYTLPASGNTDTQVTTTATSPSSEATWYLTGTTTSSTKTNDKLVKHTGLRASMLNGTTSTVGKAQITLGNSTASGTANNMIGNIALYSKSTSYHLISPADTTSAITHTLPAVTGTLINSGNLKNGLTKSSLASAATTTTSSRQYAVEYDSDGKLSVNVPWTDSNTDTKVTQSAAITTAGNYPVLLGYSTATSAVTNTVNKSAGLLFNPSTKILTLFAGSGATSSGIQFSNSGTLKGHIGCNTDGGVGIYANKIFLRTGAISSDGTINTDGGITIEDGAILPAKSNTIALGNNSYRLNSVTSSFYRSIVNANSTTNGYYLYGGPSGSDPALYGYYQVAQLGTAGDGTNQGTQGYARLALGNATARTSTSGQGANNARGQLIMYGSGSDYSIIYAQGGKSGTDNANTYNSIYFPAYNGSLYLLHAGSTSAVGSATKPVYIAANGRATACTYTLNKSVPSDAVFTDGNVKQGTSTTSSWRPLLSHTNYAAYGTDPGATTGQVYYTANISLQPSTGSIKASNVYGAVWNDYAEYRESNIIEPGRVICENGDDTLSLATERLQPGANVVSDTFGFAIGETEKAKTPIAVSGRVLVYPYENRDTYKPGDAVCAAPGGTVSKMTREEIREYPERIIGTVSAIPSYETWGEGNVPVNGRIWIKVK